MLTVRTIQQIQDKAQRRNPAADNAIAANAVRKHYLPAYPKFINWLKSLFIEPGCPGTESSVIVM